MGYTHYWKTTAPISGDAWAKIAADAKELLARTTVPVLYEYDEPGSVPEVSDELILFNGAGDDGHETFAFDPSPTGFSFCKTAHKPYDTVVTAILCVIARYAGDVVEIASDGSPAEWQPGLAFARQVLGAEIALPEGVST